MKEYDIKNVEQNKLILEELIRQQLIVQAAEQQGIDKNKDIIQAVEEFRRTLCGKWPPNWLKGLPQRARMPKVLHTKSEVNSSSRWSGGSVRLSSTQKRRPEHLSQICRAAAFRNGQHKIQRRPARDLSRSSNFLKWPTWFPPLTWGEFGFKGPDGTYYIVKLEERKGGKPQPRSDQEDLKKALTALKQQQAVLGSLMSCARRPLRSMINYWRNNRQ